MSEENKKTLEVYEKKAKDFLGTTLKHYNLNPEKADKSYRWSALSGTSSAAAPPPPSALRWTAQTR